MQSRSRRQPSPNLATARSPVWRLTVALVVRHNRPMSEHTTQTMSEATQDTPDLEVQQIEINQIEINDLPDFPLLMQTEY